MKTPPKYEIRDGPAALPGRLAVARGKLRFLYENVEDREHREEHEEGRTEKPDDEGGDLVREQGGEPKEQADDENELEGGVPGDDARSGQPAAVRGAQGLVDGVGQERPGLKRAGERRDERHAENDEEAYHAETIPAAAKMRKTPSRA